MRHASSIAKLSACVLLMGWLLSCAKVGAPIGGPKDETPPRVLKSTPSNYTIDFTGSQITITFDEFIQLRNIDRELIISPPLREKPITRLRGKSLLINLNNELKDSVTYTLNFGNAIVDLNEGNILEGYEFVFSTGPFLDSLSVSGIIVRSFDRSLPKDPVIVMLHNNLTDSAPLKELPVYVGRTDKSGQYRINNIRTGNYRLFALADLNNNLLFDNPLEEIAFADSVFLLDPQANSLEQKEGIDTALVLAYADSAWFSDSLRANYTIDHKSGDTIRFDTKTSWTLHADMFLFQEETRMQSIRAKDRPDRQKLFLAFNRPLYDTLLYAPLNFDTLTAGIISEYSPNRDTIVFWVADTLTAAMDSLFMELTYTMLDSTEQFVPKKDTVLFRYLKARGTPSHGKRQRDDKPESEPQVGVALSTSGIVGGMMDLNRKLGLVSERPVSVFHPDSIYLFAIPDTVENPVAFQIKSDAENRRAFFLHYQWLENMAYKLFIAPGAFTDISGANNDSLIVRFRTQEMDNYGRLLVNLSGVSMQVIVQLLDEKNNVLRAETVTDDGVVTFAYLRPGKYGLKAVFDRNGNGRWDTGHYLKGIQPENVTIYPERAEIRSNWDLEISWTLKE